MKRSGSRRIAFRLRVAFRSSVSEVQGSEFVCILHLADCLSGQGYRMQQYSPLKDLVPRSKVVASNDEL